MAGIYIHVPFCKQACHYCDFHFSTSLQNKAPLLKAMHTEIIARKNELDGEAIDTIYFGGGTPSLLTSGELSHLTEALHQHYSVKPGAEITLEANPDDLDKHKLTALRQAGVNRLSIGIQSFRNEDLLFMNRAHTAQQSEYAVKLAQDSGFTNITIDLIYAIPGSSAGLFKKNVEQAIDLNVPHISAYCLTFEEKTAFGHWLKAGKITQPPSESAEEQFMLLVEALAVAGFEHYEVSNFCKPGMESKHNTSYWQNKPYLGFGPSAHSYDGNRRSWNVSNNARYIHGIEQGQADIAHELLDDRTRMNEYLMTGLRTRWGIDLDHIQRHFGIDLAHIYERQLNALMEAGHISRQHNTLCLTTKGMLLADRIASDLFILES